MLIPYSISAFIYAIILITGTVTTVLFSMKYHSTNSKAMIYFKRFLYFFLLYVSSCFLYMIMAYGNNQNGLFEVAMLISDIAYFLFIIFWILTLREVTQSTIFWNIKVFIFITVGYAIILETTLFMPINLFIQILNGFYLLVVLIAAIYYLYKSLHMPKDNLQKGALFSSLLLILYVLTDTPWLVFIGLFVKTPTSIHIRFDLIIFVYFILCILWLFNQKKILQATAEPKPFSQKSETSKRTTECLVSLEQYGLTKRETEVCRLAAKGLSNPEIGNQLCISENTVKHHLNNCFKKMGIKNRYELIVLCSDSSDQNHTIVSEK